MARANNINATGESCVRPVRLETGHVFRVVRFTGASAQTVADSDLVHFGAIILEPVP